MLPPRENLKKLLTKCLEWDHVLKNTKYLLREILIKDKDSGLENEEGRALNKSETLQDVAKIFNLSESIVGAKQRQLVSSLGGCLKRPCETDESEGQVIKQRI